jgi:hypothetical protein
MLQHNAIAEFQRIANHNLDFIKAHAVTDIESALRDLQNVLNPDENYFYSDKYRDNMSLIAHLLNAPRFYVHHAEDTDAFLEIIRECIAAKIHDLHLMMAEHRFDTPAPLDPELIHRMKEILFKEGYNMSRMEILLLLINLNIYPSRDVLDDLIMNLITTHPSPNMSMFSNSYIHPNVALAINEGIITQERYAELHPFDQASLKYLFSDQGREVFHQGYISLEQYLEIPEPHRAEEIYNIIENPPSRLRMC